jgi:ADP-ribosylglycohydrolase
MPSLQDKVFGCLAASRIGSSMGAAVEGWSPERIKETHGFVDRYLTYLHYANRGVDWQRPPGTTEDGIERQKLMCRAIIEKGDRITLDDLYRVTAEATDLDKMRYMTQPEDLQVTQYVKGGVPAAQVGYLTTWHGTNFARACHPIGLINAGDPDGAVRDVNEIGRLYFPPTDIALAWAGVYVAAIAEATKPDATVDSVVASGLRFATPQITTEIERALGLAREHAEYEPFRNAFYRFYTGTGVHYAMSMANETVSKCFAVFVHSKASPKQAILESVNFGRDTDCLAATAAGLAGALSGSADLPAEWIAQLDEATAINKYTNTVCTIKEHADGLFAALQSRARRLRAQADLIEERRPVGAPR